MHRFSVRTACAAFATALLGACASPGASQRALEHVREFDGVRVEAETAWMAESVRDAALDVLPRVLLFEGFAMPDEIRIVVRAALDHAIDGRRYADRIEIDIPESVRSGRVEGLRLLVAHEIGHHVLDASWRRLPALLEEGLVEFVAQRAVPDEAPTRRAILALLLAADQGEGISLAAPTQSDPGPRARWKLEPGYRSVSPREALELSRYDFFELPIDSRQVSTALGWRLVEDRGVHGLRATVRAGANVPRGPEAWWNALGRAAPIRPISLAEILGIVGPEEVSALERWRTAQVQR